METNPPSFAFPNGHHPSSPPMTPSTRSHARFPPQTSHTSPIYKRMGIAMLAQSPPLEFIEPVGQGPQFHFTRPQARDHSSRPSTASGQACATSRQPSDGGSDGGSENESEKDSESDESSTQEIQRPAHKAEKAEFELEELDTDPDSDSDIEVLRPDYYEDASSESSGNVLVENVLDQLKELRCQEGSSDEEEQQRIYRRKKKRWSAGIFKRSHSQSIEGDSSYSDNDPLDDVDSSARRLRRRVRGPSDRTSLIFEDKGYPNSNNIIEVEEPEDGVVPHSIGPPSIPSDDGFRLDDLGWFVEDTMDVEDESSS